MGEKKFTNAELLAMKPDTLVKIKDHVDCSSIYKKGGKLVFQSKKHMEEKERQFGIKTISGPCFTFSCNDYQLTDRIIPLNTEEMEIVWNELRQLPEWIKAEKEDASKTLIQWFCEDYGAVFQEIQHYQFRVIRGNFRIDIFPQTNKFHDISKNTRGRYKDLIKFLLNYFNILRE
jgi:hypothetical protein